MNAVVQTIAPSPTPAQMLQAAIERGTDMAQLEKLMELQERWEANNARKAFVAAMAAFKADPPTIVKDKRVSFTTSKGTTAYDHATLAEVTSKIAAGLAKHGLSHRWDVKHEGGKVIVTCILTHEAGHSESVSMPAVGPEDSGTKNAIQSIGSAITYMQRYSLLAITGLAAKDQDDDGRGTGAEPQIPPPPSCTPEEFATWRADMEKLTSADALKEAWQKLSQAERQYVVKHFSSWWGQLKAKAQQVKA